MTVVYRVWARSNETDRGEEQYFRTLREAKKLAAEWAFEEEQKDDAVRGEDSPLETGFGAYVPVYRLDIQTKGKDALLNILNGTRYINKNETVTVAHVRCAQKKAHFHTAAEWAVIRQAYEKDYSTVVCTKK